MGNGAGAHLLVELRGGHLHGLVLMLCMQQRLAHLGHLERFRRVCVVFGEHEAWTGVAPGLSAAVRWRVGTSASGGGKRASSSGTARVRDTMRGARSGVLQPAPAAKSAAMDASIDACIPPL